MSILTLILHRFLKKFRNFKFQIFDTKNSEFDWDLAEISSQLFFQLKLPFKSVTNSMKMTKKIKKELKTRRISETNPANGEVRSNSL